MRENDITPSNIMEMETDVTKKKKRRHAYTCSDMLPNGSLQFHIAVTKSNLICHKKSRSNPMSSFEHTWYVYQAPDATYIVSRLR